MRTIPCLLELLVLLFVHEAATYTFADDAGERRQRAVELYQRYRELYRFPELSAPSKDESVSYQLFIIPARQMIDVEPVVVTMAFRLTPTQMIISGNLRVHSLKRGGGRLVGETTLDEDTSGKILRTIGASEVLSLPFESSAAVYETDMQFDGIRCTLFRFNFQGVSATSRMGFESAPMAALCEKLSEYYKPILEKDKK